MSLFTFHQIFISASALLALGMAAWSVEAAVDRGDTGAILLAVISGMLFISLVVYGIKVRAKLRKWRSA
jgi:hypothetical protein